MKKLCFIIAIFFIAPVFSAGTLNIFYIQKNTQRVVPRNAVRLPLAHIQLQAEKEDVLIGKMIWE